MIRLSAFMKYWFWLVSVNVTRQQMVLNLRNVEKQIKLHLPILLICHQVQDSIFYK
jgi:glycine/serine hydroxymethyltransferase